MISVIVGPNSYAMLEKKKQIIDSFIKEFGSISVERYDADTKPEFIRSALENLPFLVEKKLVVLDEPSSSKELTDNLIKWLDGSGDQIKVLILEPSPDKRTSWYKFLVQNAELISCNELDEQKTRSWIKKFVTARGGTVTDTAVFLLIKSVGLNQHQLSNELTKLLSLKSDIDDNSVRLLVDPVPQDTVFTLLEFLADGNIVKTMELYDSLRLGGVDSSEILAMLGWQLHTLLLVKSSFMNKGEPTGLHPFVIQKNTKLARSLTMEKITGLLDSITNAELSIKKEGLSSQQVVGVLLFEILNVLVKK